ncbi:hypothetical protein IFHNHDMJ_00905 [Synechococcus sp. CBW1107]|nr:hypothetical protein IFHNHDMJ_00905 [Synechococcus sp. CBW1107]
MEFIAYICKQGREKPKVKELIMVCADAYLAEDTCFVSPHKLLKNFGFCRSQLNVSAGIG